MAILVTSSRLSRNTIPQPSSCWVTCKPKDRWRSSRPRILDKTEVWFIHGNHDTDSEADHDHLFGSALADRNLHGRVVEIAGLRIAGLGGVFRGKVWTPPAPATFENFKQYLARCGKGNFWRGGLPLTC